MSSTVGEKYCAAITVTIDIFMNHFDNDHAILFSLVVCANVYRPTKCIRADKINNHHP